MTVTAGIRAWRRARQRAALDPATTAVHVDELQAQVAPELFAGFDVGRFPSTSLPALALTAAAYREGDEVGETVALALRDALFEGRDIVDPGVLSEVAWAHGVAVPDPGDLGAVLADWRRGQDRGVKGSPHFFCGRRDVFSQPRHLPPRWGPACRPAQHPSPQRLPRRVLGAPRALINCPTSPAERRAPRARTDKSPGRPPVPGRGYPGRA